MNKIERRFMRVQEEVSPGRSISGHAARFGMKADIGGMFYERIAPGAFKRAIAAKQDVKHLINHDPNLVLGRTSAGTTVLSEDAKGLKYRTSLPNTSYANDLFESISRRDINECSFGFSVVDGGEVWSTVTDGDGRKRDLRDITDCDLYDISTVTYPAYPGTSASAGIDDGRSRSRVMAMFPLGSPGRVPIELRSRIDLAARPLTDEDWLMRARLRLAMADL